MAQKQDIHSETKYRYHVFRDERFVDLNLYQFGWEQCKPLHQFGPVMRNYFLFHYVISGKGKLETSGQTFWIKGGQGFLLCPDQISTYFADPDDPWTYTWVEFDGLRARECMTLAGLSEMQPIYSSASKDNNVPHLFSIIMDEEVSHLEKGLKALDKQITVRYRFESEFDSCEEVLNQCKNM